MPRAGQVRMSRRAVTRVNERRRAEDAALAAWVRAVADCEAALAHRDAAVAKARERVMRAMRPLSPLCYQRLEAAYDVGNFTRVAGYLRDMGSMRLTAKAVSNEREVLAKVSVDENAKVAAARAARARAARTLLGVHPSAEILAAAGASRSLLAARARG